MAATLAPLLLTACFDDAPQTAASPDQERFRTIAEQIDRSMKGDRLRASAPPKVRTLEEARRAALRSIPAGTPLSHFYRALNDLQSGMRTRAVSVLHLGDSHIASDRFSGDLRALLQGRFGNAGRGMMMPGYPFPYYRARGVSFSKSGAWSAANSFEKDPGPYGLSGVRVSAREKGARLTLTSDTGSFEWAEVEFLTQPGGGEASVQFGGARVNAQTSAAGTSIKRVHIERKGRELSVVTGSGKPVSLLSWSVGQNRPGLRYVNFGIPGATAMTPERWDETLVRAGLERLQPDLIVLGYGTNEGFNDGLDARAYARRVSSLIARLKRHVPRASVLVLGPPDSARYPRFAGAEGKAGAPCRALNESERREYARLKSARSPQLARWHAPPKLAVVRASLERVAGAHGAIFWDWSKVMNGPCGIHKWAEAVPPLAASDHVHLRSTGAKRSAAVLFNDLMAGYDAHVKLASAGSRSDYR